MSLCDLLVNAAGRSVFDDVRTLGPYVTDHRYGYSYGFGHGYGYDYGYDSSGVSCANVRPRGLTFT